MDPDLSLQEQGQGLAERPQSNPHHFSLVAGRACLARGYSIPGGVSQRVVSCQRSVSHVVRPTGSSWYIPLEQPTKAMTVEFRLWESNVKSMGPSSRSVRV